MKNSKHEEDIGLIKDLMEKSSKFSNLSGIAVIATGFLAIVGASLIYFDIGISISEIHISYTELINQTANPDSLLIKLKLLISIASLILLSSLVLLYVTAKIKSGKEGIKLFNSTFSRTLKSLFVPYFPGEYFVYSYYIITCMA